MRSRYIDQQKMIIKLEVEKVLFYIQNMLEHQKLQHNYDNIDEIEDDILENLVNMRFAEDNYFFGSTYTGDPLFSNGVVTKGSESIWELTDPNGVKITQEYTRAIDNPAGAYIYYAWPKLHESKPSPKLSYIKDVPQLKWLIGAGVYLDDVQGEIAAVEKALREDIKREIIDYAIIIFVFTVLMILVAKFMSRRIKKELESFTESFTNTGLQKKRIDAEKLTFSELQALAQTANKMLDQQEEHRQILEEKETMLRNIIDAHPHLIFIKDRQGRFILANKTVADIYGISTSDIVGKTDQQLSPDLKQARSFRRDDLKILKKKAERIVTEEIITDKRNEIRNLLTIKLPFQVREDQELCVLGVSSDITDLKKTQAELERKNLELRKQIDGRTQAETNLKDTQNQLRQVIENSSNVFYTHTSQHQITYISKQIEDLLGYTPREALVSWMTLISDHPANQQGFEICEKAIRTREKQDPYELELVHKNGSKVWVEVREVPVVVDESVIVVGSLTDITAKKAVDKRKEKHKQELEKMVDERTKELNKQKDFYKFTHQALIYLLEDTNGIRDELESTNKKLLYANQELSSFAYSIAHDLGAPLRAIGSFAKMLEEEYAGSLDDNARDYIDTICSSARSLNFMLRDLLEFSKVSSKNLKRNKFDMKKLFKQVFHEIRKSQQLDNIKLKLSDLTEVEADKSMIQNVINNLLSNAVKYSGKEEVIKLEIGMEELEKEYLFFVKDNGVGFNSKKYGNKIFNVFERLHTAQEFEGTGVGLAICQRIILKHEGRIWAESKVGKGATIYFTLPKDYGKGIDQLNKDEISERAKVIIGETEEYYLDFFNRFSEEKDNS